VTSVLQRVSATETITTGYGYDDAGNQTLLTNGAGNVTLFGFNEWNLQTSVTEPSTVAHPALTDRRWVSEFDAAGLVVLATEPGGVVVDRTFDELGRLQAETGAEPDAVSASRSFGYDTAGFVTFAGSPAGDIGFVYDDRGLLVE
jgi:YD repeat-containing protein